MNGLGGKARHEVGTTTAFAPRSARRIRSYDEKAPENWCNFGPTAEVGLTSVGVCVLLLSQLTEPRPGPSGREHLGLGVPVVDAPFLVTPQDTTDRHGDLRRRRGACGAAR